MVNFPSQLQQERGASNRLSLWISHGGQSRDMGILKTGSYYINGHVHVTEAFNSDGSDTLIVGYSGDTDAFIESIDTSSTGIKSVTVGAAKGYNSTARTITATYTAGGSAPTAGKALVILEIWPVPIQP